MLLPELFDRFTTHLKESLQKALAFAITNGRDQLEPGDVLVGLLLEKGSIAAEVLNKSNIKTEKAKNIFCGKPSKKSNIATPDLSPAVKRLLEKCVLTAHLNEHKYVGTEHLLHALLESNFTEVMSFLEASGADVRALKDRVNDVLRSSSRFPELLPQDEHETPDMRQDFPRPDAPRQSKSSALDSFTRDLTQHENTEKLDPLVGRDRELDRVIQILCRRTKNNPVLLGDPGVGKTAIVEGLAQRLALGDIPDALHGKRLLSLDLALTVAGTMYRGEFEARLKQILDEAKNDKDVILFIDEIHNIVGAGSTTGSLDAANMLKPALARGEIRCIGATTWAEYKKHFEPDAALERRFQPIAVEEPDAEQTLGILQGLQKQYANYHNVRYSVEALREAVRLSERYMTDRLFPDKAIDLMDEAAAHVVSRRKSSEHMERLRSLEVAIDAMQENKAEAVAKGNLEEAEKNATQAERLRADLHNLHLGYEKQREKDVPTVGPEDVARVVATATGVPLSTIMASEREKLALLETKLKEFIVGQDKALQDIAQVILRSRLGLNSPARPKSALLLAGPSGTGKTESARQLAKLIFGREDALIKIDMTEFSEGHSLSKLMGAPAGYVGYRDANKLTDSIKKRPHSVVLFDEFEKAHPDVQNVLLQLLEDGKLTDSTGRPVTFRHAYIVLTTNLGTNKLTQKGLGFSADGDDFEKTVRDELRAMLRPELLNRLDAIAVFKPLGREDLKRILKRELDSVLARVTEAQQIACSMGDDVVEWLLDRPMPQEEGARAIRHVIDRELASLISKVITENRSKNKIVIKMTKNGPKVT
ncbi:MAG: ATP-dependent Clp protease ATP-binding subunit [Patescibacteria group bacterium]|nr:ATP-dependent Clp protease ATP-binding subunit [Patescibacteria group bacterium]